MGKWGKYLKRYNSKWETESALKNWLAPAKEEDVINGKPEAYCQLCKVHIRAHHNDLIIHSKTAKHQRSEQKLTRTTQPTLHNYGCVPIKDDVKITDLKLAVYIALHCAIRNVDHLGELIRILGKGTKLENIRLHRTKCSKLISNVIAPSQLEELVKDVGNSPYSLIVDESTDCSVTKFMGVCVRYYSAKHKKMITDFLTIIQVTTCTGLALAQALTEHLNVIKLPLQLLHSIGTDGASNMCGAHNSFFTHLKKNVPHLIIIKCVCHSLDKCAEYSYKKVPSYLDYILTETYNWFAWSTKKWAEYSTRYKSKHGGREPAKLLSLSKTRWLVWLAVSSLIVDQWNDLKHYFDNESQSNSKDFKLKQLAKLFQDDANLLYLHFLKNILTDVNRVNLAFEHTNADVTQLYGDLRNLVFSLARRVLKDRAIAQPATSGVLRNDEVQMLVSAFSDPDNLLSIDQVKFGSRFKELAVELKLSESALQTVQSDCGNFLLTICKQLMQRLPPNLDVIKKIQFLAPQEVLAKIGRPTFDQLPLGLDPTANQEILERQWQSLGVLPLHELWVHPEFNQDINTINIEHFWSCVLETQTATGEKPFAELARFALRTLTIPLSNAVVERVFSFMSIIKCKLRNKMQIYMLEALIRLRVHLKVLGKCCKDFEATRDMLNRFNSSMYAGFHDLNQEARLPLQDLNARNINPDEPEVVNSVPEVHMNEMEDLPDDDYGDLMQMFEATDVIVGCVTAISD